MSRNSVHVARMLIGRRWFLLSVLVGVTVASGFFLKNLRIDNSLEVWFLEDDPALRDYEEFKEIYGNDEILVVWMQADSSLYEQSFVETTFSLSRTLERHPLVKRILSITSAPYIAATPEGGLIVEDTVVQPPDGSYSASVLEQRLSSNPLWKKLLLSRNTSAAMLFIEPVVSEDMDVSRPELLDFVKKSLSGVSYRLAGMGVVYEELNRISMRDSSLFTLVSYAVLLAALLFFFRRLSILGAATLTIVFSTLLVLGICGLFRQSLNMITAILPSLVIILCLADIVHVFSHYRTASPGPGRLRRALSSVLLPCFFTTVTTAVGFSSLGTSPMKVLRSYGLLAAAGVLLAYAVSMVFCALVLARVERKEEETRTTFARKRPPDPDRFDRVLGKVYSLNREHHRSIVAIGALLIVAGGWGLCRLTVDTHSIDFLLDTNRVKKDSHFIEREYGYYVPLEIRLIPKAPGRGGVKEPDFLRKLDGLQERLDSMAGLEKSTSLADVVKHLHRVLTDNRDESHAIPETRRAVAQELLLYEFDADNDLEYFVDTDYSELRLTVRVPMASSRTLASILDRLRREIEAVFADTATAVPGGYVPLYVKMMDYIVESQVRSFLLAFVVVFLVMALLFRSWSVIAIGIVPNLLPIFLTLGLMGWLSIPLDIATVTVAAIAMGISVDDSIHFIFTFRRKREEGFPVDGAIEQTLLTSGRAIIITSLLLILGYLVFALASVKSVIFMGLLIAATMLSALLCDLFLLPALLFLNDRRRETRISSSMGGERIRC